MKEKRGLISSKKKMSKVDIETALLENFVNLQRVLTNVTIKFETLSENVSSLLGLFEIAAQSFIKKYGTTGITAEEEEMLKRLDTLIDQNKTIAKGLTLLEEKVRHKLIQEEKKGKEIHELMSDSMSRPKPRPLPRM